MPICYVLIILPLPRQISHFWLSPCSPPLPLHTSQSLSLLTLMREDLPLYKSPSVHLIGWITDFVFCGPFPDSPNIAPKKSCGFYPAPGCFMPSSPYLSYAARLSGSDNVSFAFAISSHLAGSPPLSGCSLIAFFLYAFLISASVAFFLTPRRS